MKTCLAWSKRISSLRTASAWVLVGEYFPFMVGPDRTGEGLGVVRLGGHIQPGEAPWQCAVRVEPSRHIDNAPAGCLRRGWLEHSP